jgi:hypothetical protein
MRFSVKTVTKSFEFWEHQPEKEWFDLKLHLEIAPLSTILQLGSDKVICNEIYYEAHPEIQHLKRIFTHIYIFNRNNLSDDVKNEIEGSFGKVNYLDTSCIFSIFLEESRFLSVIKEVSSYKNIYGNLVLDTKDNNLNEIISYDFVGSTGFVNEPKKLDELSIQHFSLNIES